MNETKSLAMPLKATSLDEAVGAGSGYLATFGNIDKQGDAIQRGAFARSIAALEKFRKENGRRYLAAMLWQHNPFEPIGGILTMKEDSHGLYIEFELDLLSDLGKRAYGALKKGYVGGFSIGYRVIRDQMRSDGVRLLLELELIEGSVVTFPANEQAVVLSDSMKHETTFEDEVGALLLSMKGTLDHWKKRHGAQAPIRSEQVDNNNKIKIHINRDYGMRRAAQELDLPERIVRVWYDEAAAKGELSRAGGNGTWSMSGYELCRKAAEHSNEIFGAWIAQGTLHDGILLVTHQDNRALNAAFVEGIPEATARDARSDKEAADEDYDESKFRTMPDAEQKVAKKEVDTRFFPGKSDDEGYERPLMDTRDMER